MPATVVGETSGRRNTRPRPLSPEDNVNIDAGRESLNQYIKRLYGEEICQHVHRLEALRDKKAHRLSSLIFLLRCRDSNIIPQFLKMKRLFYTARSHRIYNRMERDMLRERIHSTRKELALIDKELLQLHLMISNNLRKEDWDRIDTLMFNKIIKRKENYDKKHHEKFKKRVNTNSTMKIDISRTVINLTEHKLTEGETSVLSKGGNFAVTPSEIPTEDIIANVEAGIRNLPVVAAEEIRSEIGRILQKSQPPRSNLTNQEKRAIKSLNADKSIVILPADKGNATVIMNITDYKKKIQELLEPHTYKKLSRDPTSKILQKTNYLIKNSSIPSEKHRSLCKTEALPPRLYGLPKIHKNTVPLRPIVSSIDSPTYNLAKYLVTLLQPYIGQTESYIRDSTHLIEKLTELKIRPNDILVSFDVISLFTKVPLKETLTYIADIFPEDITQLFHHCLTTSYFQWNQEFYELVEGVAMGSPLSPVVANFFMEKFEEEAITTAVFKPSTWLRYVDDTFIIWSHGDKELHSFLRHLNSLHPSIQFTMEVETDLGLPFLDVLITRKENQQLGHTVYRKPTHTDRYLHKNSNHHPRQKRSIIKTLTERAKRICEPENLKEELKHLDKALQQNGYSSKEIKRAAHHNNKTDTINPEPVVGKVFLPYIKNLTDKIGKIMEKHKLKIIYMPTTKIKNMLHSVKDSRDPLSTAGVYRIPCSCGAVYIGTTQRSVKTRLKEHERHCRLIQPDKSSVALHYLETRHKIRFEDTQVLSKTSHYYPRIHREAIEIYKHKNNFNKKEESLKINKTWLPALKNATIYTQRRDAAADQSHDTMGLSTANQKPVPYSSHGIIADAIQELPMDSK